VAFFGIVYWSLNADISLSPLMVLGTQWYILFNVIAGAAAMPTELRNAADSFGVRGLLWWRRVAIPAVFPHFVTGDDCGRFSSYLAWDICHVFVCCHDQPYFSAPPLLLCRT
jgi:ABC-type anion transport system duplicated permease subunit